MTEFDTRVTGWLFIAAAAMLWSGWSFLPVKLGAFFQPEDFERVHGRLHLWIWVYRIQLFGYIVTIMAFVALATFLSGTPVRTLVAPAAAVCGVGLLVTVLAQAFYYHFGVWGAIDMNGKSTSTVATFVESLKVSTEYVTCFGRVFFGLGQAVLAVDSISTRAFSI